MVAICVVGGARLWSRGDLNRFICDGDCGPANIITPRALTTRATPSPAAPVAGVAGQVDRAKLSAAVGGLLRASVLGPHVGFAALDPEDGTQLASAGTGAYVPASTTKVLTSFAALSTIDPQTRFTTTVVRQGSRLVLVGGGDPYLAVKRGPHDDRAIRADLTGLAKRTAAALTASGLTRVRLDYDASLFTGPASSQAWEPSYVPQNVVTPVSALWVDQGVQGGRRSGDPAASAARSFATLLEREGMSVTGTSVAAKAPQGAAVVATVRSATVARIVETLIRTSDNQAAEVMLRHIAIAAGRPATFDGGTAGVTEALRAAAIDTTGLRLDDGSGLSRHNRISPLTLVQTLRAAASAERTSGLLADLPVSGFTGTLANRFAGLRGALGAVRAKTGTLSGVHSLAGYAIDAEGRPVLFAVMSDRSDRAQPAAAQAALDKVAAAIATCRCGTGP